MSQKYVNNMKHHIHICHFIKFVNAVFCKYITKDCQKIHNLIRRILEKEEESTIQKVIRIFDKIISNTYFYDSDCEYEKENVDILANIYLITLIYLSKTYSKFHTMLQMCELILLNNSAVIEKQIENITSMRMMFDSAMNWIKYMHSCNEKITGEYINETGVLVFTLNIMDPF